MTAHARYSPSGSKRWMACPGSLTLEAAFPDVGSDYSDNGTAMHTIASRCLTAKPHEPQYATAYIGEEVNVAGDHEEARHVTLSQDFAEVVNDYATAVRAKAQRDSIVLIEHRVDFSEIAGVPGQFGTADAVMLHPLEDKSYELDVTDLKTGFKVVSPVRNSQLMIYALGALAEFDLAYDISQIRLSIFQPEQGGMVEWTCSVQELREFGEIVKLAVRRAENAAKGYIEIASEGDHIDWQSSYLNANPNEDECAFCRAMSTCPAMRAKIERTVGAAFDKVQEEGNDFLTATDETTVRASSDDDLSSAMAAAGVLEDWIKAVRAEVERRLMTGVPVPGYGLELGREGARAWVDPKAVETYLKKSLRLTDKEMYDFSLISPTTAERLANFKQGKKIAKPKEPAVIGERQWTKLQAHIKRSPAKPSVKPVDVIKEPWTPPPPDATAFGVVADDGGDLS